MRHGTRSNSVTAQRRNSRMQGMVLLEAQRREPSPRDGSRRALGFSTALANGVCHRDDLVVIVVVIVAVTAVIAEVELKSQVTSSTRRAYWKSSAGIAADCPCEASCTTSDR